MSATTVTPPDQLNKRRAIFGGAIGTVTEYYDFAIYGLLTPTIASQFFPTEDPTAALLSTFVVFAVGFLFRPIGGIIFGYIGDRCGRMRALTAAILLMSAATMAIGLLPTFASVGLLSPLLLVVCRCLQSMSNGGELAGATSYLAESAPRNKRARYASAVTISSAIPTVIAVIVILAVSTIAGEAFATWGWRVPFLLAAPLGLVGLYLRMRLAEPEVFTEMKASGNAQRNPLITGFRTQWRKMILIFLGAAVTASAYYIFSTYMVTYMTTNLGVSRNNSLFINGGATVIFCVALFLWARAADKIGRRPVLMTGLTALVVLGVPAFMMMQSGNLALVVVGQVLFGLCLSPVSGVMPVLAAELFPTSVRYSCNAMSYNLAYTIFGGTAPFVAVWLVSTTGLLVSPGIYASVIALVAAVVLFAFLKETKDSHLEQGIASDEASFVGSVQEDSKLGDAV